MSDFVAGRAAAFLASNFRKRETGLPDTHGPETRAQAYQVQDLMIEALGGACGWKVGRSSNDPEPYCAPIPLSRRLESGSVYLPNGGPARLEAELGFRLGRDVPVSSAVMDRAECVGLIDAILPAIEILETRLAPPAAQDPLWKLADLQANGGLVLGEPVPWAAQDIGKVCLGVGHDVPAAANHPFGAPLDLFCWTVNHVSRHRGGLERGDVIITGSYCGIVEIGIAQRFVASFADYGEVSLSVS